MTHNSSSNNLQAELARVRREQAERYRAATSISAPHNFSSFTIRDLARPPPSDAHERQIHDDEELARRLQAEEDASAEPYTFEQTSAQQQLPDFLQQLHHEGVFTRQRHVCLLYVCNCILMLLGYTP